MVWWKQDPAANVQVMSLSHPKAGKDLNTKSIQPKIGTLLQLGKGKGGKRSKICFTFCMLIPKCGRPLKFSAPTFTIYTLSRMI